MCWVCAFPLYRGIVAFLPSYETLDSQLRLRRTRGNNRAVINKAHDAEKGLTDAARQRFFPRALGRQSLGCPLASTPSRPGTTPRSPAWPAAEAHSRRNALQSHSLLSKSHLMNTGKVAGVTQCHCVLPPLIKIKITSSWEWQLPSEAVTSGPSEDQNFTNLTHWWSRPLV